MDRYSRSDRNTYGAEGDAQMDSILDALEKAVEADEQPDGDSP